MEKTTLVLDAYDLTLIKDALEVFRLSLDAHIPVCTSMMIARNKALRAVDLLINRVGGEHA